MLHDFSEHTKSHNMKALAILSYSWSPFLPLTCLYGKMNFCGYLCGLLYYFLEKQLSSDYPCKSYDHDHQWAVLVMAWLPQDKIKWEHNIVRLMFVYILRSTCQSMSLHGIGYKTDMISSWYKIVMRNIYKSILV